VRIQPSCRLESVVASLVAHAAKRGTTLFSKVADAVPARRPLEATQTWPGNAE
jgi:hypothetical protein